MPPLFCHRLSSRSVAVTCVASLSLGVFLLCPPPMQASSSHHASEVAYARAIAIQQRLQAKPVAKQTRLDYERALDAFRAVYHEDPASPDAPRSIAAVADLLANEGRYAHEKKLLHDAIAQWEFLRQQYPTSSLRKRALFEEAQIQQYDLRDRAAARKSYRRFLTKYPHDALAGEARAALRNRPGEKASPSHLLVANEMETRAAPRPVAPTESAPAEKSRIKTSSKARLTSVANQPDSKTSGPASSTEIAVKASPSTAVVEEVRYWDENGSTRLAVNLSDAVPYHTYSDQNGRRITIVFFGAQSAETLLGHAIVAPHDENLRSVRVSMLSPNQATLVLQMKRPVRFNSFVLSHPSRLILDLQPAIAHDFAPEDVPPVEHTQAAAHPIQHPSNPTPPAVASQTRIAARLVKSVKPLDATNRVSPAPPSRSDAAEPTPTVQPSMARVLGLRIRRIVIDAGHGGHDSGTIGPGGIEEKDIALDVALRLGHLLHQRLGAEVIYTRRTDKYVPLEERTAIANAAHADLFLSIHANSSSDPDVRGVETYFLNFTTSPDAMAVASRENADSNRSVYDLSDLVRKITLGDKIDESREFAGDVQQQLYSGLLSGNPGLRNRGVKQAPFVVLIGAQMPSILAEISFLTNPEDAAELSLPRYRERLAEALYRGVAEYVDGMSGVRIATTIPAETLTAPAE